MADETLDQRLFYVYAWYRDRACTEIFYVGKGTRRRETHWQDMRRDRNRHLKAVVAAVVSEFGFVPTRRLLDNLTDAEARQAEIATIAAFGRYPNGPLVNMTDGGVGGPMPPQRALEHSYRMRGRAAPNKGKPMPPEQRAALKHMFEPGHQTWNKGVPTPEEVRAKQRGLARSPETRAKMSAAKKGRPPHNKGKPMPLHQVEQQRQRLLGTKQSAVTRARMSQSHRQRLATPEARARQSAAAVKAWITRRRNKIIGSP